MGLTSITKLIPLKPYRNIIRLKSMVDQCMSRLLPLYQLFLREPRKNPPRRKERVVKIKITRRDKPRQNLRRNPRKRKVLQKKKERKTLVRRKQNPFLLNN